MRVARRVLLLAVIGLQLGACASLHIGGNSALDAMRARMRGQGAALVTDGCVVRDPGITGYTLIGESRRLAGQVAHDAGEVLRAQQVPVLGLEQPFVCGSMAIHPQPNARVAEGIDQVPRRAGLPLAIADKLARDDAYRDALLRLMYVARAEPSTLPPELFTPVQAATLKQRLGTGNVLVLMAWGSSLVPADPDRSGGCAVLAVAGKCARADDADADHGRALASVIDLDARAVVWTEVQRFRADEAAGLFGTDAARYDSTDWLRVLLRPLL